MPRKPKRRASGPDDPRGMERLRDAFMAWMRTTNYSEHTIYGRQIYLDLFIRWATERGIARPADVTQPILERYQHHLMHLVRPNGKTLAIHSQYSRLVPLRAWFRWLSKRKHILYNPAADIDLPRLAQRLPKHVLSVSEVETVLAVPDVNSALGVRDRAMLETFYSTGMRRMELAGLKLGDLDAERGTLIIRQGKGKRDRMLPFGQRAAKWVAKYARQVRPELVVGLDEGVLFLTSAGERFAPGRLSQLVRGYVEASGIGKTGACHLFRHTMATLMLEGGADIRFIQQMLGHARLETTQIYTQVSIRKLKQVHASTHPGARLDRSKATQEP